MVMGGLQVGLVSRQNLIRAENGATPFRHNLKK
jgi:hypothetical protein